MCLNLLQPRVQFTRANMVGFGLSQPLQSRRLIFPQIQVEVCPSGQTTGCRTIGINVPDSITAESAEYTGKYGKF